MLHGIPPVPMGGSPPAVGKYARAMMCCIMLPAMSTQRRGARARSRRSSSPQGLGGSVDMTTGAEREGGSGGSGEWVE